MTLRTFEVRRDDWTRTRVVEAPLPDLRAGEVLLRVDRFALTSNNVTYAAMGDALDYWGFFPSGAPSDWGRVPAMGFADVAASAHPDVAVGERVFGFFPMASHLLIHAGAAEGASFEDDAPHRASHAPAYRRYTRTAADPLHDADREDAVALLRGLFLTSFLVDDFLAERDFFGAERVVVTSASSKTAIALAHLLHRRGRGEVVGLTSPRHVAFVEGLGDCDRTLPYADVKRIPGDEPAVLVDHAGDPEVVGAVHQHLGDLRHSAVVGATHWRAAGRPTDLPGPPPSFFFAPTRLAKRSAEWGPAGLQERLGASWRGFLAATDGWLRVVRGRGTEAMERAWAEVLEGRSEPARGHVLSLAGEPG